MPSPDGRPRVWAFEGGDGAVPVEVRPTIAVDEALTIHRPVRNGAGIGVVSAYLCEPDIARGRLVRLLDGWSLPPVPVWLVLPSRRELAPAVRALADFLREVAPRCPWGPTPRPWA